MATKTVFDADGNEYEMELDDDDVGTPDTQRSPAEWAKLRRSEKATRDAKQAADLAARTLAFYRAGINPDDPRMSYFVKGYEGDLATASIRDAATQAGFLSGDGAPPPVDPTGGSLDVEQAGHAANARITAAGTGASPTSAPRSRP
jgi:hypothetical protein